MQGLRREAAEHRTRAGRADALAAQLVEALAAADGRLQDPSDLGLSESLLTDGVPDKAKIGEAIEDLIARKPHLRSRRPTGVLPQGAEQSDEGVSLAGILRAGAG